MYLFLKGAFLIIILFFLFLIVQCFSLLFLFLDAPILISIERSSFFISFFALVSFSLVVVRRNFDANRITGRRRIDRGSGFGFLGLLLCQDLLRPLGRSLCF